MITDFDVDRSDGIVDYLILDSGTGYYDGYLTGAWLVDGSVVTNSGGVGSFYFATGDYDDDGTLDLNITSNGGQGSVWLLGVSMLQGDQILGG